MVSIIKFVNMLVVEADLMSTSTILMLLKRHKGTSHKNSTVLVTLSIRTTMLQKIKKQTNTK